MPEKGEARLGLSHVHEARTDEQQSPKPLLLCATCQQLFALPVALCQKKCCCCCCGCFGFIVFILFITSFQQASP